MASFGKKTPNPGWKSGDYWGNCDRCSFTVRVSSLSEEWNGLVVCNECFEPRHPQDLVKGVKDDTSPRNFIRPDDTGEAEACSRLAIAGSAIAGCAVAGVDDSPIPQGTFTV